MKVITRLNRHRQTEVEKLFWKVVKNRGLNNIKFRRQHLIQFQYENKPGYFVVDFYASEFKIIIELDGSSHENKQEYDSIREKTLTNYLSLLFPSPQHGEGTCESRKGEVVPIEISKQ